MTGLVPLMMAGHDRTYMPPRSVRRAVTAAAPCELRERIMAGEVTAWDLFELEGRDDTAAWATATLASLVAAVEDEAASALGCTDCEDTGFYGVADAGDPDLLVGLVKRVGDEAFEALAADGSWGEWTGGESVEVLDLDTAGDLGAALLAGASGLLRRFCEPLLFLPPQSVVSALTLRDVLSAEDGATPQPEWVNYAIVDEKDPGAVYDLVRIQKGEDDLLERWDGVSWTPDAALLSDAGLPLSRLSGEQVLGVQEAVTHSATAMADPLVAANLPDPRGERLRQYWEHGKGALKIRWNTPSDWKRCVRHLTKYMGTRARGYCQLMHRRTTGVYTGSRLNVGGNGRRGVLRGGAVSAPVRDPSGVVLSLGDCFQVLGPEAVTYSAQVIDGPTLRNWSDPNLVGKAMDVLHASAGHVGGAEGAVAIALDAAIPQPVAPKASRPGVANFAEVEQPLLDGSTVGAKDATLSIGVILTPSVEEVLGALATLPDVLTAAVHVALRNDTRRAHGVSPERIAVLLPPTVVSLAEATSHDRSSRTLVDHTVRHGFHNTRQLSPEESLLAAVRSRGWRKERTTTMPDVLLDDGVYTEADESMDGLLRTLTAGGFPVAPPDEWFEPPKVDRYTPLVVEDDGRVFGHIAPWGATHIGMAGRVQPPHSQANYAYFRTGAVKTATGKTVNVGQITLTGGHAPINATAAEAVKHYDDTASAVADLAAGEDSHGIWVAGALRSNITPEQVRAFRASAVSGDWRPIGGGLELVAICSVNVPGFMSPRAEVLVAGGAIMALVAAGVTETQAIRASRFADEALEARLLAIEAKLVPAELVNLGPLEEPVAASTPPAAPEVEEVEEVEAAEITEEAPAADPRADARAAVNATKRQMLRERVTALEAACEPKMDNTKKKKKPDAVMAAAQADGSYPIKDVASLKDAISAFGRSKDKAATKRHIISMCMKLGHPELIPDNWRSKSNA